MVSLRENLYIYILKIILMIYIGISIKGNEMPVRLQQKLWNKLSLS